MDEPSNWFTKLETEGTLSNYNHRLTNPLQSPTINNLLYKTPHIHNYVYYRPTNEWTITWTQLSMNQYMVKLLNKSTTLPMPSTHTLPLPMFIGPEENLNLLKSIAQLLYTKKDSKFYTNGSLITRTVDHQQATSMDFGWVKMSLHPLPSITYKGSTILTPSSCKAEEYGLITAIICST
ncbi:unnamed protein product [Rhizophagus irregularis]|nr:unnamed protein product [Rhizophagus irregularis]